MNDLNHIYKVGNFICELREKKSLSQSELGKIIGVTNKAISRWENGRGYPDTSLLVALASALDVTVDEILRGEVASNRVNAKEINKKITKSSELDLFLRFLLTLVPFILLVIYLIFLFSSEDFYKLIVRPWMDYGQMMFYGLVLPLFISGFFQTFIGLIYAVKITKRKDFSIISKIIIFIVLVFGLWIFYFPIFLYMVIRLFRSLKKHNI